MTQSNKKDSMYLIMACFLVYMLTSVTKSNYTSSVAYVVNRGIFSKENSGAIASAFYIFYGIGQFLGGIVVDRVSPYKMIMVGIIGALVTNALLCLTTNYYAVLVIWSISGLSQFAIWPGVCKIVSTDVLPGDRNFASYLLSYGIIVSGLLSYIFSGTILESFGWSAMFLTSVLVVLISFAIWITTMRKEPERDIIKDELPKKNKESKKGFTKTLCKSGMVFLLFGTLANAMLSTGAKIWIPTMIMESYKLSSQISSFAAVFLIIVQIIGLLVFARVLKHSKRPIIGTIVFYLIELLPLIVLLFIGIIPVMIAIIMMGMQAIAISLVTPYTNQLSIEFNRFGFGGTYVGLANAFASLGVVLSSSLYGVIAEEHGWRAIIIMWIVLTLICVLCSLLKMLFDKMFKMEESVNE